MLQCPEHYHIRPEQDGSFICDTRDGRILVGNSSATEMLAFLRERHTAAEVIAHLKQLYAGETIDQHADGIMSFLQEAVRNGFLVEGGE